MPLAQMCQWVARSKVLYPGIVKTTVRCLSAVPDNGSESLIATALHLHKKEKVRARYMQRCSAIGVVVHPKVDFR